MISFLLGLSIAFNIIFIILLVIYVKYRIKKEFFNDSAVVDKEFAEKFFG